MSRECPRYANYIKARQSEESYEIINSRLSPYGDNGCCHRLRSETWRIARGFKKLYASLPVDKARNFHLSTPFSSEAQYYRYKRGEYPMPPAMQKVLLRLFGQKGADTSVGFDRYEEKQVYISVNH